MQHFPKKCFHFPESSVKFASSTKKGEKNEVGKFGEVRSSSSTEILYCNPYKAFLGGAPSDASSFLEVLKQVDAEGSWQRQDLAGQVARQNALAGRGTY